jgi:hypothetical protein
MRLQVRQLPQDEVYRDLARIHEDFRLDNKGSKIPEGTVCKVSVSGKSKLLYVRQP